MDAFAGVLKNQYGVHWTMISYAGLLLSMILIVCVLGVLRIQPNYSLGSSHMTHFTSAIKFLYHYHSTNEKQKKIYGFSLNP